MATVPRRVIAIDCETDPFKHNRIPKPFIWGAYDGTDFLTFTDTAEFVAWLAPQRVIAYAHNGGKFDFMFLLSFLGEETKAQIINGRIVKMNLGKAELRDSYAAVPEALGKIGKKDIDYAKLEENVRHMHMPEIIEYLEQDCVSLFNLITEYRRIAGKQLTIASNALRFLQRLRNRPRKN